MTTFQKICRACDKREKYDYEGEVASIKEINKEDEMPVWIPREVDMKNKKQVADWKLEKEVHMIKCEPSSYIVLMKIRKGKAIEASKKNTRSPERVKITHKNYGTQRCRY